MAKSFNNSPFYDDFDEKNNFAKILFRPGYAVQGRELNQLQSILQNQISRFGASIYQSGSPVLGGETVYDPKISYLKLQTQYANNNITLSQFNNNVITDTANNVRAQVITISEQTTGNIDPPTLFVKYLTGSTFSNNSTIKVEGSNVFANITTQGLGSVVSINDGVFFLDLSNLNPISNTEANSVYTTTNGYFVRVPKQTLILDKYSNTPTYKVGLEILDSIITEQNDSSLLDPALESSNYQAPGAARYVIDATLSSRILNSTDDTSFIELMRIDNGVLIKNTSVPIYSNLMKTLARRTDDQSGNFTVNPFLVGLQETSNANNQLYTIAIDPGKAYVKGYEYETLARQYLIGERARDYNTILNGSIQTQLGNYLNITDIHGTLNISTLQQLDLHCVSKSNVNVANTAVYNNTIIGTARIRSLIFDSAVDTTNTRTYVYKAYLFDVNTSSIIANSNTATPNTITFDSYFSNVNNAYQGMVISIPNTGDTKTIISYNGMSKTATVDSNWSVIPLNGNTAIINCDILDIESIGGNTTANFISANANVDVSSKSPVNPYHSTFLSDTNYQSLVFKYPFSTIKQGSITGKTFSYISLFSNQSFTSGNITISSTGSETFIGNGSLSDASKAENFMVIIRSSANSLYAVGNVIPLSTSLGRDITITGGTGATITLNTPGTNFTADIYAKIQTTSSSSFKTKTLISANTTVVANTGGTTIVPPYIVIYPTFGQINFGSNKLNLMKTGVSQRIGISDGIRLVKIVDSGDLAQPVTNAMLSDPSKDITYKYSFDGGQRDNYYDNASLTLKPGYTAPIGQVLIMIDYFLHSGTGFFDVDSYSSINYEDIPDYYNSITGEKINLRDAVDFRPRRSDLTTQKVFDSVKLPIPDETFDTDTYSYYLPRTDVLTFNQNGNFILVKGVSSSNPVTPSVPDDSMTLYTLKLPAYTFDPKDISLTFFDNRRYTMRDIGLLEKRINNLEYYTSLNALEQDASNKLITDSYGFSRPKNGMIVDSFSGHAISDVTNEDYICSIDKINLELRPSFDIENFPLVFDQNNSSNFTMTGKLISLPYTTETMVDQSLASRLENLNPFNVLNWSGELKLNPESDYWYDIQQLPDVIINSSGENDNWTQIGSGVNDSRNPTSSVWNTWRLNWAGIPNNVSVGTQSGSTSVLSGSASTPTVSVVNTPDTIIKVIGDNIVNAAIIPYIREKSVRFVGKGIRPKTTLFAFFDDTAVSQYVTKSNLMVFNGEIPFLENETIVSGSNTASVLINNTNGRGNTYLYIIDAVGEISSGQTWTGANSGVSGLLSYYSQRSGTVDTTISPTSTSFKMQKGYLTSSGEYAGNTVYITEGTGKGQTSNISSYTGNGILNLGIPLSVIPDSTSVYSISNPSSDYVGICAGKFNIPSNDTIKFRTGQRIFRLIDSQLNDIEHATTRVETRYTAEGILQQQQTYFLSTRVPVYNNPEVTVSTDPTSSNIDPGGGGERMNGDPDSGNGAVEVGGTEGDSSDGLG